MDIIQLTEEQLKSLAVQISEHHPCRFDEVEIKSFRRLALVLENGGLVNLIAVVEFGGFLNQWKKTSRVVFITLLVGGTISAVWAGILLAIRRGGGIQP